MQHIIGVLARDCPSRHNDLWLADSTPVECGRSRETVKRSDMAGYASYGYCASHTHSNLAQRNQQPNRPRTITDRLRPLTPLGTNHLGGGDPEPIGIAAWPVHHPPGNHPARSITTSVDTCENTHTAPPAPTFAVTRFATTCPTT